MLNKIKKFLNINKRSLNMKEETLFKKTAYYFMNNCHFVYSLDYIPRLIRRLYILKNDYVSVVKGKIIINRKDKNIYKPYVFNMYKGNVIDLNLFVLKYVTTFLKENGTVIVDKNLSLPNFVIEDIPKNISYKVDSYITFKDCNYQTSCLYDDYNKIDDLILAMYNDCKLQMVFDDIKNMSNIDKEFEPNLHYVGEFESVDIKGDGLINE